MTRVLKNSIFFNNIKKKKRIYILKMFNRYLITLLKQEDDYIKLKMEVIQTPLEKSIEIILEKIKLDIEKIKKLNQIENI